MILFERNLSPDIRLYLIEKKFHVRLASNDDLENFFRSLQVGRIRRKKTKLHPIVSLIVARTAIFECKHPLALSFD